MFKTEFARSGQILSSTGPRVTPHAPSFDRAQRGQAASRERQEPPGAVAKTFVRPLGGRHGAQWVPKKGPGWRKHRAKVARRRSPFERCARMATKGSKKPLRTRSEAPLALKIIGFTMVKRTFFISSSHLLLTSPACSKSLQDLPKMLGREAQGIQDGARMAPRGAQETAKKNQTTPRGPPGARRAAQERPKRRPRTAQEATESRRMAALARGPIRRLFLEHFSTILGQFLNDLSCIFQRNFY